MRPLHILSAHNLYREAGGEDRVFADEARLLESRGHWVERYLDSNDRIGRGGLGAAAGAVWSAGSYRKMLGRVRGEGGERDGDARVDVAHFHNTFPLISPAAYYAVQSAGVPVVQTLHNYRLLCPGGSLSRGGSACEACLEQGSLMPAIRNRCYRGSRAGTVALSAMLTVHRSAGTYGREVDAYIAQSEFAKRKFVEGGLPEERIFVKGNFVGGEGVDVDVDCTGGGGGGDVTGGGGGADVGVGFSGGGVKNNPAFACGAGLGRGGGSDCCGGYVDVDVECTGGGGADVGVGFTGGGVDLGASPTLTHGAGCSWGYWGLNPALTRGALFVGRLSEEKGVRTLAAAFSRLAGVGWDGFGLTVVGDGPLRDIAWPGGVAVLGARAREEVLGLMREARVLVFPSICYENCPMVILEAMACGLPVIASDIGSMPELVRHGYNGLLFRAGDAEDLAAKVRWAFAHPEELRAMRANCRREYEDKHTPERNYAMLTAIYEFAIESGQRRRRDRRAS